MVENITIAAVYIFEAFVHNHYYSTVFEQKKKMKSVILLWTGVSILLYLGYLLGSAIVNVMGLYVLLTIAALVGYQCNWLRALFHAFLLTCMMVISEMLVFLLINQIFHQNMEVAYTQIIICSNAIISKLIYSVACRCIEYLAYREEAADGRGIIVYLFLPIVSTIITLDIFYLIATLEMTSSLNFLLIFSIILLLFSNLAVFYLYERQIKVSREFSQLQLIQQKQEFDHEHYKLIQKQYSDARILVHDIKNQIALLTSIAQKENATQVLSYISSFTDNFQLPSIGGSLDNKIFDVVCAGKKALCESKGIKLSIMTNNLNIGFMDDSDLCSFLGNLLDNAIEAAEVSNEKKISFEMYEKNEKYMVIKLLNSCDNKPIEVGGRLKSRKLSGVHGVGMYSIERCINKYNGQSRYEYNEDNKTFTFMAYFEV